MKRRTLVAAGGMLAAVFVSSIIGRVVKPQRRMGILSTRMIE